MPIAEVLCREVLCGKVQSGSQRAAPKKKQ